MKYGIYYAYWEKEWNGDYKYYIDKISKLGFDILEISCGAFSDYYTKDQELIDIGKYAKEKGVTLTAGYGPHFNESLSSSEPNMQKQAISFWKETLRKLKLMDIHIVGGALYGYWPVDYSLPLNKKEDMKKLIYANLWEAIEWLEYNLKRSLCIESTYRKEEIELAEEQINYLNYEIRYAMTQIEQVANSLEI